VTDGKEKIGTVKTVLVFGRDPVAKAVVANVIACRTDSRGRQRVRFTGSVQFSNAAKKHIRSTILSIVDRILSELQLPNRSFEVSAMNLGAASALDVGVRISGYSADVPVFIALLSAGLQLPLTDDFVATGHIASVDAAISAVRGLPAKVQAVDEDSTIARFFYPDLEHDQSMKTLSPSERERGITAIMAARDSLKTKAVCGIDQIVKEVFTEESIALASLTEGLFWTSTQPRSDTPVARVISLLTQDNDERFWRTLQACFLAGECDRGKRLLKAMAEFLVARKRYASGMGTRLLNLMRSLPPAVRRLKIEFPLLDTALCIELGGSAARTDYDDVLKLLDAVHGKGMASAASECAEDQPCAATTSEVDCIAFDTVVSQINEQALARRFGIPIDSARGSYILDSSTVQSEEEFFGILEAFYVHLHSWTSGSANVSFAAGDARHKVTALLESVFRNKGGREGAYARARDGTQGGMRSVLDTVAEQCKRETYTEYVQCVFAQAVSGMKWGDRVQFMRAAMKRLGPVLPPELRDEPPERFVRQYEVIVRAYVESLDRLRELLQTL
jgi:hypothetical protein